MADKKASAHIDQQPQIQDTRSTQVCQKAKRVALQQHDSAGQSSCKQRRSTTLSRCSRTAAEEDCIITCICPKYNKIALQVRQLQADSQLCCLYHKMVRTQTILSCCCKSPIMHIQHSRNSTAAVNPGTAFHCWPEQLRAYKQIQHCSTFSVAYLSRELLRREVWVTH